MKHVDVINMLGLSTDRIALIPEIIKNLHKTSLVKIQFLLHVLQNQKINIFHPKPE